MFNFKRMMAGAVAASCILAATQVQAFEKVYSPYVDQGETEIEYQGKIDNDGAWQQKMAVGYGVNAFWFTELYGEVQKAGKGADTEFSAVEWENRFQLTQAGEYWVDVGFLTELEANTTGGAHKAGAKLLLAKDTGAFSHLANIGLEKEFGQTASSDVETEITWSSRYRYNEKFEPGFEIHSEFGAIDDAASFNNQSHLAGLVFYGKLGSFKYDVGYLFGVSKAAPDSMLKTSIEYELRF